MSTHTDTNGHSNGQALALARAERAAIMENVIVKGDLSRLSPEERSHYYAAVCDSIGVNPLTRPLEYITLNGKLTLYARRDCADQLRKLNGISIEIVERAITDGLLMVHVRARDKTGRTDEDFGVLPVGNLKGEALANQIMKAVTKAKRRVTLSISGLGLLDETEIETIPDAKPHVEHNGSGGGPTVVETSTLPSPAARAVNLNHAPAPVIEAAPTTPAAAPVKTIPLDFGDGLEWVPVADVASRIYEHLVALSDKAAFDEWRDANKVGRTQFHVHDPRGSVILRQKCEAFLASLAAGRVVEQLQAAE